MFKLKLPQNGFVVDCYTTVYNKSVLIQFGLYYARYEWAR